MNKAMTYRIFAATFFLFLFVQHTLGQAPQGMNYQTVIRDGNNLIQNQSLQVKFSILEDGAFPAIYQETHSTTTNDFGLVNLVIGQGTVNVGDFGSVDWGNHTHFLKVEVDNGSGFLDMGTTQLVSVPYSLYAQKASEVEDLSLNDLTDVSSASVGVGEVLKWDGTNWTPAQDNVATGGGAVNTTARISGDGSAGNPLDIAQQAASSGQALKWNGTNWAPDTDETADADADPANEIQALSISGSNLSLSNGGGTVALPSAPTYSAGTGISISGTTISNTGDSDADPSNEIQSLSISGSNLSLSNGGGTVALPSAPTYSAGTGISISGTTISNSAPDQTVSLSGSGATSISGSYPNFTVSSTDNVNDADASTTNEIQSMSLSGNTLSLSLGGGSVNLASFASPWNNSGSNLYFNTGKVGIGDNSPVATLTVGNGDKLQIHGSDGDVVFKDDQGSLRFANSNGSNSPMIHMFQSGTNNSTRMLVAHSPNFSSWGIQYNDTADAFNWIGDNQPIFQVQLSGQKRIGIGTSSPSSRLHIEHESNTSDAHIKLTETQFDYSRIKFNNNIHSNFWDIAARTDTNLANAQLNFYHSDVGDIFVVNARGRVGINDVSPSYAVEINGKQSSRIMNLYNTLSATTGTTYNYGVRVNLSQSNTSGFPRLYNIYGISTDNDAYLTYGLYGYASGASNNNYGVYAYAPTSSGYAGYFNGNTYATGSYQTSDVMFKSDIQPMTTGLTTIMSLKPKTYHFKRNAYDFMNLPEGEQFGFVAQELEAVVPNLVAKAFQAYDVAKSDTPEGQGLEFKAVNYVGLIPVTVSAIQEQQKIIEEQKSKIQSLEERLERLEALMKE